MAQEGCCVVKKVLGKGKGVGPYLGQTWARSRPDLGQIGACQLASVGCVMIRVRSLALPNPGTFVTISWSKKSLHL